MKIRVGACADLALFSTDELRFAGAHDPLATLVLSGAHRAEARGVQGEGQGWEAAAPLGRSGQQVRGDDKGAACRLPGRGQGEG